METSQYSEGAPEAPTDEALRPPRADLWDACGWILLGVALLVASINMDRLEHQHINPYTIPGLLPGLLGIGMMILGSVLGVRSWRRGALTKAIPPRSPLDREQSKRVVIATILCVGYGVVLIGHGLPFWLASTIYVTTSILVFQRLNPDPAKRQITPWSAGKALLIGLGASLTTWLIFEKVFLVRMP